jgi:hypothetical protein
MKKTRCPNGTRRNKQTGLCEGINKMVKNPLLSPAIQSIPKPKKNTQKKKTRCPNGTRRNKQTGLCEGISKTVKNPLLSLAIQSIPKPKKNTQKKKTRCPNGTRRNKQTGLCEIKTLNNKLIEKSDLDTISDSLKSIEIEYILKTTGVNLKSLNDRNNEFINIIKTKLQGKNSYTPSINNLLLSIRSIDTGYKSIFGCGIEHIISNTNKYDKISNIKVNIGSENKKICVGVTTKKGIEFILTKFKRDRNLIIRNIIPPLQVLSNCWFNVCFMTFFVSDKGKKFMRFFRQLLIEGKTLSGKKIPTNLHKAFILFNASIEACYNYDNNLNLGFIINTNHIIKNIYNIIKNRKYIYNIDVPGNPVLYYLTIMSYIYDERIWYNMNYSNTFDFVKSHVKITSFFKEKDTFFKDKIIYNTLILEMHEQTKKIKIKKNIKFKNGIEYILDSVQLIDHNYEQHFTNLITINGKEYKYDGASLSNKIKEFKWSKYLNSSKSWKFPNSTLLFNFKDSYKLLYYYRSK